MHMQNLTEVMRKLSDADAARIVVVFVTTDPERDTPERLSNWLASISPRIVGLRPEVNQAIRIQSDLGIQPAMKLEAPAGHEGNYQVIHAAQVFAFTADNKGHAAYPFGTRQADWAHDLPVLLKYKPDSD
jgi:protein SCO1/2